ncbi:MAG: NAD(P)-dependent glycerol-3-phosphate dehydrogenase [Deltaproteobacteria bacterium]|nr:NAD(P)-dependent glycerol-3-phosphate dehydrogenase [Deltaproteobacteria bacterium]
MGKAIGVIGAGGWGTALAKLLCEKGHELTLWCRGEECCREIQERRENRSYLAGILLPLSLKATRSLKEAVSEKELLFCAVPSHGVRDVLEKAVFHVSPQTTMVCGTKGIEEKSLMTMGEVIKETFGESRGRRLAFLSGPTFALEVAQGLPAAITVAASVERVGREIQETLSTQSLRVYTSKDVVGVQMGGVVKNVIAIAAGISDGLGLGYNARAALITRGLAEMTRLAIKMGGHPLTLSGLPGLGDLILTCTGELSRNRRVGIRIGQGEKLQEILDGMRMVAEGVRNTRSVHLLAGRLGVEMPIVEQMHLVLYEGKQPLDAVRDLMQRSLKAEIM